MLKERSGRGNWSDKKLYHFTSGVAVPAETSKRSLGKLELVISHFVTSVPRKKVRS